MAYIYTKSKLIGFLMVLCLLSAVCVASVSAADKLIIRDNGTKVTVTGSGTVNWDDGCSVTYHTDMFGRMTIKIFTPGDKDKDKAKK